MISKHDGEEMLARSEHNEMIAFPSDLRPGSSAMVRLTGLKGNTYTASVVQWGEEASYGRAQRTV